MVKIFDSFELKKVDGEWLYVIDRDIDKVENRKYFDRIQKTFPKTDCSKIPQ
jgi:hypothetical protein